MTDQELYINACRYAVEKLVEKGSTGYRVTKNVVNFDGSIEEKFAECNWSEVLVWLYSLVDQESGWIHVSERLPEEGQWVMVTFDGKIAVCIAQDNDGTLREATSLVFKNATEIWLYPESEWGDGYAAWMPLPAPFEPQESEDNK